MRIKILLISLGMVSLVAVGIATWIYFSSQAQVNKSHQEQTELKKQASYLQEKLDSVEKQTRHWQGKSEEITSALNRLGKEHTVLQGQCDSLIKEKDRLEKERQSLAEQVERMGKLYAQQKEKAVVGTSDQFLSSLLQEKASLEVQIEELKGKISAYAAQLEDMERVGRPSLEKIERLEQEKVILEKDLEEAKKVTDVLSNDLLKERKKRSTLESELIQNEERLNKTVQEKDKLSDQLSKMKQALEERLAQLNETKQVLETAVEGAKAVVDTTGPAAIELSPIVVKAEEQQAPMVRLRSPSALSEVEVPTFSHKESKEEVMVEDTKEIIGTIITVNDKHNFVVVDIGRDSGVETGMKFDVYRKNEKIGRVEVVETRKNISACDVKEMNVRTLQVNDTVRR